MSHIDELIEELCPNGVEYRELGDAAVLTRGTSITSKQVSEGEIPVIGGGRSAAYTHGEHNRVGETVVVAGSGAYAGYVSWWDRPIFVSDAFTVAPYASILVPRYCFHWLRSRQTEIHALKSGGGVPHVYARDVGRLRIPVPPLGVQQEVVRILDKFTALEAELEAELEARRKQYEHYRAELLSSECSGSELTLGEVFTMRAGSFVAASEIADTPSEAHPYPCFGGNGQRGYVSIHNYDQDVVLIGRQGALCGNVHRSSGLVHATEHAVVVTPRLDVDMAWAYHMLTEMDLNQYKTKSAQPGLAVRRIEGLQIAVPPLDEQRRIANILDKFDALVNDLSVGLPAELAARRKQYEYYRDRLLTFKELAE